MIDAILYAGLGAALMYGAGAWFDEWCWFWLMRRVHLNPAAFLLHAQWHVSADKAASDTLYKVSYLARYTRGLYGKGRL